MSKIFVSYRRQDSGDIGRRLADTLARTFGADAVFIDTDTINEARQLMAEFFDKLRIDRKRDESLKLVTKIDNSNLKSRT